MTTVFRFFSFLCAQDAARSFVIAGHTLPLCQRCTGVYVGLAVSSAFLWLGGFHRRGLPPRSILYANIAALALMPVFGFHLLDPGPLWRLWTGLVFGNAVAFLAVPAAFILRRRGRLPGRHTRGSVVCFWIFYACLNTTPLSFSIPSPAWYYTVLALCLAGVGCAVVPAGSVAVSLLLSGQSREVKSWVGKWWRRWLATTPASR
jgi:uncharacterized membrane protein